MWQANLSQASTFRYLAAALYLAVAALSLGAQAQEPEQEPADFAETVKNELVEVIRNKDELEQQGGEEEYVEAVEAVLDPVVDFEFIARGVMGEHADEASEEQRQRFAQAFKKTLVDTYANGLAGYGHYDIEVVPPEGDVSGERNVGIWLNVSNDDTTHRLAFSLRLNDADEWRLTNMILNGVNLGKAFRGQFDNAMERNDGDIDAVIENWTV